MWFLACVLLFGQCEEQRIVNINEVSRFYVAVRLPSGHRTQIPVINGYLPQITEFRCCNNVELVLDYGASVRKPFTGRVDYTRADEPKPEPKPEPRPVPLAPLVPVKPPPVESALVQPKPEVKPEAKQPKSRKAEPEKKVEPEQPVTPEVRFEDPLDKFLRQPSEVN